MVFVHFKDPHGNVLFQNDPWIDSSLVRKTFGQGEMKRCVQQVVIPDHISFKGPISVWLGIWDPKKKKRFKPETSLVSQDRSVRIAEMRID